MAIPFVEPILGILDKGLKAWNDFWERRKVQDAKNTGALEQREHDHDESDKALAGDRVRNANADLQQRVRDEHGIEVGTQP